MKRVLSISTLYPNAAKPRFGTFVARSMEALAAHSDWDVTVINPIGIPPIVLGKYRDLAKAAVDGIEHGIQVYRPTFTLIPKIGGRFNPDRIVKAVLPLARKLHAQDPFDVLDAQFFYPDGPAIARIAEDLGLPFSIKARGADIHYWGATGYGRAAMRKAAASADGLLSVCEALATDMAAIGLSKEKITIHYTGLDRDRFRPLNHTQLRNRLSEELGIPLAPGDQILATTGALIPRKGQKLVIDAMPRLASARLLLVGQGGDEDTLRSRARELGVDNRVHFLGLLDHDMLPIVLSAADAMVLPSASEGLANAWIEALACGTPVVITGVGGAHEVVTSRDAGLIVDRTAEAIAEGVANLLANPPAREATVKTADRFDWKANGQALAAYFDRLIAAPASAVANTSLQHVQATAPAAPVSRKRLLSISTLYPNSAAPNFGNFVEHTLEALVQHEDWEVSVINPVGIPPLARGRYTNRKSSLISAQEHDLDVHRVSFPLIPLIGARRNARSIAKAVLPLAREMHAAHPFDLVDAQFFFPDGPAAALIAADLGIPFSITARGSDIHYWAAKPWARHQIVTAGLQADGLVAVSTAMAADLERLGMPRSKILVHLTGIDHHLFRPHDRLAARQRLAQDYDVPEDGELLASLGALIPLKGQDYLVRALTFLPGKRALLIGEGPERGHLVDLAKRSGVADRVHFAGSIPHAELPPILSAADAMVLPSQREGLANAWIEALACGTPLVIPEVGGASEVVSTPAAGRLVERTPEAIAQGVLDLLGFAPPQQETATAANRFSWENNARALSDFYRGLGTA